MKTLSLGTISVLNLAIGVVVGIAVPMLACSGDGANGSSSGATVTNESAIACNESHDGSSACGGETCRGGTYCLASSLCQRGCRNENHCPRGQRCDKSTADNDGIGTCRPCAATPAVDAGGPDATPPLSCAERCRAKAEACGATPSNANTICSGACTSATDAQMTCLEATACATLAKGGTICGLVIEKSGGGS